MRRKLIEQVIEKACMLDTVTAGSTTAHVSSSIDREGFLTAFIVAQTKATAGETAYVTWHVYDSSDNSTFAIYDSANATCSLYATTSVTADGFSVDLAGANRYIKVYATPSEALTVANTIATAVVLGDAVNEPAS